MLEIVPAERAENEKIERMMIRRKRMKWMHLIMLVVMALFWLKWYKKNAINYLSNSSKTTWRQTSGKMPSMMESTTKRVLTIN